MVDAVTKQTLSALPLLKSNAGPRDAAWPDRLKEELLALITVRAGVKTYHYFLHALQYVKNNKANDNDWFKLECNKDGTRCGAGRTRARLTALQVVRQVLDRPRHDQIRVRCRV